jgi:hypothetical protein
MMLLQKETVGHRRFARRFSLVGPSATRQTAHVSSARGEVVDLTLRRERTNVNHITLGGTYHMKIVTLTALAIALAGCASSSAEITPAYVSPFIYQNLNCQQLA